MAVRRMGIRLRVGGGAEHLLKQKNGTRSKIQFAVSRRWSAMLFRRWRRALRGRLATGGGFGRSLASTVALVRLIHRRRYACRGLLPAINKRRRGRPRLETADAVAPGVEADAVVGLVQMNRFPRDRLEDVELITRRRNACARIRRCPARPKLSFA